MLQFKKARTSLDVFIRADCVAALVAVTPDFTRVFLTGGAEIEVAGNCLDIMGAVKAAMEHMI